MEERIVKGIWIPIEIWKDKNITWNEKILLLEIDSYTSKDKDCFISNEYISELLGINETNASKTISSLIKKGYVIKTRFDGRKRYVKSDLSIATTLTCCEEQISRVRGSMYTDSKQESSTNTFTDKEEEILKEKTDDDIFVDNIYAMYPAKCPVRNTYLGKCSKDKDRIRKLLKTYSKEDIEKVVTHEVDEKFGKSMMQNFSTFLNNFPDPNSLFGDNVVGTLAYPKSVEDVKEDDIQPTYDFFVRWLDDNCRNLLDNVRVGYPNNNIQYKRLAECTKGGTRGVAYVCLVLNRDGWDKYYDKRGFMWIYSNYIKANGLFIG